MGDLEDLIGTVPRNEPRHEDPTVELETVELEVPELSPTKTAADSGVTAVNVFRHPDSHPYVLDYILTQKYGAEWLAWEPETLELHLQKDFPGGVSEANFTKVQALKTMHLVDTFWKQWEVFLWCTVALNGVLPDFDVLQIPTAAQALVAIDIAFRVRDDVPWSEEVKTFLGVVFSHDGIFCPPPPADFVEVDTTDLAINCAEIQRRWPEVRASGRAPTGSTVTDEQLRRLLALHHHLEESRARMHRQEPLIRHA